VTNLVTNLAAKADKITGGIAGAQVSGMLSPDATGSYSQNGTYNGSPAFERVGGGWWLRYDMAMAGSYYWRICQGTSVTTATPRWNGPTVTTYPGVRPDPGSYTPVSGATGIATVTASQAAVDYLASYDSNGNLTLSVLKTDVPIKSNGTFTLAGKVQEGTSSATGSNAHAEGESTTASAQGAHASGNYSTANKLYQRALSSGRFMTSGDSQYTEIVLRRATSDATPTELTIDGATPSGTIESTSNRFICATGKTYACLVMIAGRRSDGTSAFFLRQVMIKSIGSTVSLDGSVQTVGVDINPAGLSAPVITADNMNKSLVITVTGTIVTSIRWSATIQAQEITY
jgi:hypothetical protein